MLFCLFSSFAVSLILFYEVGLMGYICFLKLPNWFNCGILSVNWSFLFDTLTVVMLVVVLFISSLVHLYSISYMGEDPHIIRFLSFLSLFTFFMLFLITAGNYVQFFLGWEGVGLCSYLLVNFWYTREQANKAAMKAIIVNRVGDFFLLLGLLLIFFTFRSLDFLKINAVLLEFEYFFVNFFGVEFRAVDLISFLLLFAAVGKSAQIGLHTWLPDAMEGPTPVSALIHAATMVTAGIFLILRSSFIIDFSVTALDCIVFFGAITAIFASTSGLFQYDLKKVIAYSTSSQLGYMFLACGTSNYNVAIFHLYNHAFFKALLFLGAGSVIHALNDEQDMRKMGGLFSVLPFTFLSMLVGTLALTGLPFLTGFYSKDLIIETIVNKYNFSFCFGFFLSSVVAFFTSFYSFRLLLLTFFVDYRGSKSVFLKAHDAPVIMGLPLLLLALLTIVIGFISKDMFMGISSQFWQQAFVLSNDFAESSEFLDWRIKLIPLCSSLMGIYLAFLFYSNFNIFIRYGFFFQIYNNTFYVYLKNVYFFFGKKWHIDFIYNKYIVHFILSLGYKYIFKTLDRGLIEFFGPLGLTRSFFFLSNKISELQTGLIYHYFIVKFLGFFIFVYFFIMGDNIFLDFISVGFIIVVVVASYLLGLV